MQGVMCFRDRRHLKGAIHCAVISRETTTGRQGETTANADDLIRNTDEQCWKILPLC